MRNFDEKRTCLDCKVKIGEFHLHTCSASKGPPSLGPLYVLEQDCEREAGLNSPEHKNDAWLKYMEVIRSNSFTWEPRSDLKVEALGCDRAVRISIGKTGIGPVATSMTDQMRTIWETSGPRNVSTMREFAQAILHACDFVDEVNPRWSQSHRT